MQTSTELTIRNYHIDHFGHVNHARYVEFLEEARWQYLERNQLLEPIHRLEAFHVVSEINIEYRRPAILGEVLRIDTSIDGRWRNGFRVVQNGYVKTSGKTVVKAVITNRWVDAQGRSKPVGEKILRIWRDLADTALKQPWRP